MTRLLLPLFLSLALALPATGAEPLFSSGVARAPLLQQAQGWDWQGVRSPFAQLQAPARRQ